MSEKIFLCRCTFCLDENQYGVLLNNNTFNRHRSRIQEYSVRDENWEGVRPQMEGGIPQYIEDDVYQNDMILDTENNIQLRTEYNIQLRTEDDIQDDIQLQTEDDSYQQKEDNLDLINSDSDTESVNFNEEDGEYYYDYYDYDDDKNDDDEIEGEDDNREDDDKNDDEIEEEDDNREDDDDDDDDNKDNEEEEEEDDDNDNDNDDDAIHVDNKTNIPIEGLKLLHLKSLYNFTESAYEDIMKIFMTNNVSLYKIKKYLKEVTGLVPVFYDMCENSCICYTGQYEFYQNCPICHSIRLDTKGKAKKVMPYLSVIDRLKIQFNNENRAKELLYRHEYITNKDDDDLDDVFDRKIYKELVNEGFFNDNRDIAFSVSCDGYQIFKQRTDDCWLFLMINNNLDPSLRVKKENLLVPFLIPGPNQPKDFNTFLRPFIEEMKKLERKKFILSLFL
jgi:hypothetical protein